MAKETPLQSSIGDIPPNFTLWSYPIYLTEKEMIQLIYAFLVHKIKNLENCFSL